MNEDPSKNECRRYIEVPPDVRKDAEEIAIKLKLQQVRKSAVNSTKGRNTEAQRFDGWVITNTSTLCAFYRNFPIRLRKTITCYFSGDCNTLRKVSLKEALDPQGYKAKVAKRKKQAEITRQEERVLANKNKSHTGPHAKRKSWMEKANHIKEPLNKIKT